MDQVSHDDIYYKQKYLKYKKKYLGLQQQGGIECKFKTDRIEPKISTQLESMEKLKILKTAELEELKNFPANDPNRLPSWCDRILYREILSESDKNCFRIDLGQYDSYTNDTIIKSDHDLVYGIFNIMIPDK